MNAIVGGEVIAHPKAVAFLRKFNLMGGELKFSSGEIDRMTARERDTWDKIQEFRERKMRMNRAIAEMQNR